jgi:hypothetical protein
MSITKKNKMTTCKTCQKGTYTADASGSCLHCRIKGIFSDENEITDRIFCIACQSETITVDESGRCAACRKLAQPYYGRFDELTVDDVKFLIGCGIEID